MNISLTVTDETTMQAYVAKPTATPRGGLILIQEAYGVNDFMRSVADRFAKEGYLVVTPELFHRTATPGFSIPYSDFESAKPHYMAVTDANLEADLRASFDWLKKEGVTEISAVGFCMGGRASFVANSILPLKAAVSFYGGGMDKIADRATRLHAPQLLLWGGKDAHITPDVRAAVSAAFTAAGKTFVDVTFSDADHAFFRDVDPTKYHKHSAELVWPLVLQFLA